VTPSRIVAAEPRRTVADEKTYAQQIEEGKQLVRETLARLARELKRPDIDGFEFMVTPRDLDDEQISIYDPMKRKVVTKLRKHDLADSPAPPSVKRRLQSQVDAGVRSYYALG
jgi:hypothetical protein